MRNIDNDHLKGSKPHEMTAAELQMIRLTGMKLAMYFQSFGPTSWTRALRLSSCVNKAWLCSQKATALQATSRLAGTCCDNSPLPGSISPSLFQSLSVLPHQSPGPDTCLHLHHHWKTNSWDHDPPTNVLWTWETSLAMHPVPLKGKRWSSALPEGLTKGLCPLFHGAQKTGLATM